MASSQSPDEVRTEALTTESKEQAATPKSPDEARPETLATEPKEQAETSKSLDEARPETLTTEAKEHEMAASGTPSNEDAQPEEIATEPKTATRPHLFHGTRSQMETQYVNMLLAKDEIHVIYNALAGFFTWILLAGLLLFPGTFTSLQNVQSQVGATGQEVLNDITHLPL
jgi:hypothetical protein